MRPVRIIKSKALGLFTQVSGVHDSCKEIGIMNKVPYDCTLNLWQYLLKVVKGVFVIHEWPNFSS